MDAWIGVGWEGAPRTGVLQRGLCGDLTAGDVAAERGPIHGGCGEALLWFSFVFHLGIDHYNCTVVNGFVCASV